MVFKSAEDRAAERQAREVEEARAEQERAEQVRAAKEQRERAAYLATPLGAADAAMAAGEPFFEVQLEVGRHTGTAGFGAADGRHSTASSATILGEIEQLGWRLEHASYVFMVTGESSTSKVFATGEATAVSGVTVGVYLFRNGALAPRAGG
jgi:hypothetical protein